MEPAWATAGAAYLTAAAAWWAAMNGVRTLRQTRADSTARSRPMMAAELRMARQADAVLLLVIRNFGSTIARNVRVSFHPRIPETDDSQSVAPMLKRRYAAPIPCITPGMELSNVWFVGKADEQMIYQNLEPMPDPCTVKITSEASDGTVYIDEFVLDVEMMKLETYVTSSTAPEARLKQMTDHLKTIEGLLKRRGNKPQ